MNSAMITFNNSLFKSEHKSFYSNIDIDILDEYRTLVPMGMLKPISDDIPIVEIDVSKAFTHALIQITQVPIFNEFDNFKPYDNQKLKAMNLYIVKTSDLNMMFNKTFNLCYGKFLPKYLKNIEILFFKEPSFLIPVNYTDIVDALNALSISHDEGQNKFIKKLIANVNFGLLEKSNNKSQKSILFSSLEAAKLAQEQHGGSISILRKFHEIDETFVDPLGVDENDKLSKHSFEPTGNEMFCKI